MTPTTLAIIQARMSSSRLPGKVLREAAGKPLLQHMFERVKRSTTLDGVVLATTLDPSDDVLERFADTQGLPCYRGSLADVLDRFYQAANHFRADIIVRLTGDCPLIDPHLLDLTVKTFLGLPGEQEFSFSAGAPDYYSPSAYPFDFATNRMPPPWKRSVPIGLDVEVCSFEALQRAWKEANQPHQREHVMPYLYEGVAFNKSETFDKQGWFVERGTTPHGFRIAHLRHTPDYGSLRWTVDTPADLEFVRQVLERFADQDNFGWQDVVDLIQKEPELSRINANEKHRSAYDVDDRYQ